jgi:hypothetical protein
MLISFAPVKASRFPLYNRAEMTRRFYLSLALATGLIFGSVLPGRAWTPATQVTIATEASRLAPADLARQIERHRRAFEAGAVAPFDEADPGRHAKNPDGSGSLDRVVAAEVEGTIQAIRSHWPFEEVVRRLGIVSHYVADANNPLAASGDDGEEGRYFVDYLRYAETAEPRFPLVFYGFQAGLEHRRDAGGISPLIAAALRRGREVYPMIGFEYRRIGFASGIGRFDDRSSAFGVASVSFSHAVTDLAEVLRYIWLAAGGADDRSGLRAAGDRVLRLPRAGRTLRAR